MRKLRDRLIRLLRLIYLIQSYPGIQAKELAERCEVTDRTIYRDLVDLTMANVPLSNEGYGRGYRFTGRFALYPLDLTEQEMAAFQTAAKWLESAPRPLPPGWKTVYEKVVAAHAKEKRVNEEFLQRLQEIVQLGKPVWAPEVHNVFPELLQAMLHRKTVDALYHSQKRNETSWRRIDPYHLLPREHRFYLVGFCHKNGEFRTFRVSRFLEVRVLDEVYPQREFDLEEYMKDTWSIERGDKKVTFRVRFSPAVARYVKEEELFLRPRVRDLEDGSLLFEVTVNGPGEFLRWLRTYGPDAEILEPAEYRREMRETLSQWLERYQDPKGPMSGDRA